MLTPLFDVVIPTKNEASNIIRCLSSIHVASKKLDEGCVNIILVDGGSDDGTPKIAQDWSNKKSSVVLKVIYALNRKMAHSRILGAKNGKGEIIVFFDADDRASPNFFIDLLSSFQDPKVGAVLLKIEYIQSRNCAGKAMAAWEKMRHPEGRWPYITVFRRSLLPALEGVKDMNIGEDHDRHVRLKKFCERHKFRIVQSNACVYRRAKESWSSIFKSGERSGRSIGTYITCYPSAFKFILWSIMNASLPLALLLIMTPLNYLSIAFFAIYLSAWTFFILKGRQDRWILLAPLAQFIMGLGFVWGMVKALIHK